MERGSKMKKVTKKRLWKVVDSFLKANRLTYKQKLLAEAIFWAMKQDGKCVLDSSLLCSVVSAHVTTMYRYREVLVGIGLIRHNRIGIRSTYEYTLNFGSLTEYGLYDLAPITLREFNSEELISIPLTFDVNLLDIDRPVKVINVATQNLPEATPSINN